MRVLMRVAAATAVMATALAATTAPAPAAPPADTATSAFSVLPPGNGDVWGPTSRHRSDQIKLYDGLESVAANGTLGAPGTAAPWYKPAGFTPDRVVREERPKPGVVIQWDSWGVPYIKAAEIGDAAFGSGWVMAEARLALLEALRTLGRGGTIESLTATGTPGGGTRPQINYSDAELQTGLDELYARAGEDEADLRAGLQGYVDGINAWLAVNRNRIPWNVQLPFGLGRLANPKPWRAVDVAASAVVINDVFGVGGGGELGAARTLRTLAKEGRDAFYAGEIAADIVNHIRPMGSLLTLDDFDHHSSAWVKPISAGFAGHDIFEIPPSGQGLTALIALRILSRFGLKRHEPDSPERMHLEIEAMKLAWELRNRHVADPDFAEVPVSELLGDEMTGKLAGLISMNRALDIDTTMRHADTIYLSVVDRKRMAVSFINSIYHGFGSAIVTPRTGIALQNRGACFVTNPHHPNCIAPGKRPLHTIIPAMVTRHPSPAGSGMSEGQGEGETLYASYGVMGGFMQPQGHVQALSALADSGLDPQSALDLPRFCIDVDEAGGRVAIEEGMPKKTMDGLKKMGHPIYEVTGYERALFGRGQVILRDPTTGVLIAGSDLRADGCAMTLV